MTSHKSFKKAAGFMLVAVLASRVLGLVRDMLIARQFGSGGTVSAYTAAFNLPDLLYFFLSSGALSAAFIPEFTKRFETGKKKEAWEVFSIIACFMGLVLLVAVVIFWIYAKPLVSILAVPGFVKNYPELVPLTVLLTRIILPCQLFFFVGGVMSATLESRRKFSARAMGPVIYNLGIIFGAVVLSRWFSIAGLALGTLIGAFVGNIAYTFYCMKKEGFEFYPSLNLRHPGVIRVAQLALPVVFGMGLPQIDVIVNRWFASYVSDSAPAALNYANRLMQVPLGIFAQAAGTAILPMLAAYAAKNALDDMRSGIGYGLRAIMVESIPATFFLIVMADPLVRTIFMSGEFRPSNVSATVIPLIWYSVGIFAWAGQAIVARGFFALQDTVTPVVIGTISTVIFIPLNWFLMHLMGTGGIALATSIAVSLHFLGMTWYLKRRLHGIEGRKTVSVVARIMVAASVMVVVCFGIRLGMSQIVGSWQLQDGDFRRPAVLASELERGNTPVSAYLYSQLSPQTRITIDDYQRAKWQETAARKALVGEFNTVLRGPSLYDTGSFAKAKLSEETRKLAKSEPSGDDLVHLNRLLLNAAYPGHLRDVHEKGPWLLRSTDIDDAGKLALLLADYNKPISVYMMSHFSARTRQLLSPKTMPYSLMHDLNELMKNQSIYSAERFKGVSVPKAALALARSKSTKSVLKANRLLLEAAYPMEIVKRPAARVEGKMGSFLTVLVAMVIGGAVYMLLLRVMKVTELDYLWDGLRRRLFKRGNGGTPPPDLEMDQPGIEP